MKTEFLKVKFEADAGSSGSDLEIVCIKPASKKAEGSQSDFRKKRQAPNPRCVDLFANKATTRFQRPHPPMSSRMLVNAKISMSCATCAVSWLQTTTHTGLMPVTGTCVSPAQIRQSGH